MRESEIQSKILSDLESYKPYIECFKIEKANKDGVPDVFFTSVLTGGVFLEVKKPGEKPSETQTHQMRRLDMCGCRCFVVDCVKDWISVKRSLKISENSVKSAIGI